MTALNTTINPRRAGEDEPLLGRAGDASQQEGQSLSRNLIMGTAVLAQAGIILLLANICALVLLNEIILFSAHPLLNSVGILALFQSILILQPTHTVAQKRSGTIVHAVLNNVSMDFLVAGLVVIEFNKISHNGSHFISVHGILGMATYVLLGIQAVVGFTQYFTPSLYGTIDNAKSIYKYHRMSGYLILIMMLATLAAATQTDYNLNVLHIKLWVTLVTSVMVLAGVFPRIKKRKLGLVPKPSAIT